MVEVVEGEEQGEDDRVVVDERPSGNYPTTITKTLKANYTNQSK